MLEFLGAASPLELRPMISRALPRRRAFGCSSNRSVTTNELTQSPRQILGGRRRPATQRTAHSETHGLGRLLDALGRGNRLGVGQEFLDRDFQSPSQTKEIPSGDIELTALYSADVVTVHVSSRPEIFLRPCARNPERPNPSTDAAQKLIRPSICCRTPSRHRLNMASLVASGLHIQTVMCA